jgi:hypothetical protein
VPHSFYIYNISSDDSAAIQTARAEIYLFTTGTPYKIDSRTLVFAPSGQGFFHSNLPARSHSETPVKCLEAPESRNHFTPVGIAVMAVSISIAIQHCSCKTDEY